MNYFVKQWMEGRGLLILGYPILRNNKPTQTGELILLCKHRESLCSHRKRENSSKKMWYPRRQPSINLLHVDGKILLLFMTELVSTFITWFYFLYIKNPEFISNTGIQVRLVLGHASRKIHIMKDARCYLWGVKFVLNGRS